MMGLICSAMEPRCIDEVGQNRTAGQNEESYARLSHSHQALHASERKAHKYLEGKIPKRLSHAHVAFPCTSSNIPRCRRSF